MNKSPSNSEMNMDTESNTLNHEALNAKWIELKQKIKDRFAKLSDGSIEDLEGNLELLSEKLQNFYGYAKFKADKELADFKASLNSKLEVIKKAAPVVNLEKRLREVNDKVKTQRDQSDKLVL